MIEDAYLATVARSLGCPEMWIPDCLQEMRLAIWRKPEAPAKLIVRMAAIDFLRHYGPVSRHSTYRRDAIDVAVLPQSLHPSTNPFAVVDELIDLNQALTLFRPRQRAALITGKGYGYGRMSQLRKRLRETVR